MAANQSHEALSTAALNGMAVPGAVVPAAPRSSFKRWLFILGLAIAVTASAVLWEHLRTVDFSQLMQTLRGFGTRTVLVAIGCCAASFILLGIYESIALRAVGQPVGLARPMLATWIATPIGHAVGFAVLTAGALRYRLYAPLGISRTNIAKVVLLSAFPFVLGMMLLFDLSLLFGAHHAAPALRLPVNAVRWLGAAGLCKDALYVGLTWKRKQPFVFGRFSLQLPAFSLTLLQFALGVTEIIVVAMVMYLFMPPELEIGVAAFIAIYLVGIVVSQLSNIPAGLGVLEASLLLMLPQVAPAKLLAAVLAYRVIFEAGPLLLALLLLSAYELGSRNGAGGRLWRTSR